MVCTLGIARFMTVRHDWSLRLDFMTSLMPKPDPENPQESPSPPPVLQIVETDDRGSIYTAVERLYCESFDCHVPVVVLPTNQEIPEDRAGVGGYVV